MGRSLHESTVMKMEAKLDLGHLRKTYQPLQAREGCSRAVTLEKPASAWPRRRAFRFLGRFRSPAQPTCTKRIGNFSVLRGAPGKLLRETFSFNLTADSRLIDSNREDMDRDVSENLD